MSRLFTCCLVFTFFLGAPSTYAQSDVPPEVQGIKIVIPMARGKSAWGTKQVTKSLRKFIAKGTSALVPSKKLRRAQKNLGHTGSKKYKNKNLATAGRAAGADYVLMIKVTKKGWAYTAHAILVNTVNGNTDMDFRSSYFKPKEEGPDRGVRIAKTTLGKIAKLIGEDKGPPRLLAQKSSNDDLNERMEEEPPPRAKPTPKPSEPIAKNDPLNERLEEPAKKDEPIKEQIDEPIKERMDDPVREEPRNEYTETNQTRLADSVDREDRNAAAIDASVESENELSADASSKSKDSSDAMIHFRVGAGSNFAHSYKLSSENVENSGVSYPLSAMSLFASHLQFNVPGLDLGVLADVVFVPVRLRISINNSEVAAPDASLLDMRFGVNYVVGLTDNGSKGMRIVPGLGARISQFSVDTHPGPIVLSNSSLSPIVFSDFWLPVLETIDLTVGVEAGYVASFDESPGQSGSGGSKQGLEAGGSLGLYLWLSDMVAVTVHLQSLYQQIQLSGAPNRQLPPGEEMQLIDPTVSVFDARGALGVELRI